MRCVCGRKLGVHYGSLGEAGRFACEQREETGFKCWCMRYEKALGETPEQQDAYIRGFRRGRLHAQETALMDFTYRMGGLVQEARA